jgi:exopolyphosphatase/guanosine-5'-triphosphate,3'-diphosphate pyrophosphatase
MGADDVTAMTDRLIDMTFNERVANPCIGADRADLVLAGCAIFEAIRREWPCGRLRVADRGLREGMLVELMAQDGVWRRERHTGPHRGQRRARRRTANHSNPEPVQS